MIKKETYIKMKNEINLNKKEKQKNKNNMNKINDKKAIKFKNDLNIMQKGYNKAIIKNRIKGFMRAYSTIKYKFDNNRNKKSNNNSMFRNNSCILHNNYSTRYLNINVKLPRPYFHLFHFFLAKYDKIYYNMFVEFRR